MLVDLHVGDIVEREDGRDWTVKAVNGASVVFVNEAGETEQVAKPVVEAPEPTTESVGSEKRDRLRAKAGREGTVDVGMKLAARAKKHNSFAKPYTPPDTPMSRAAKFAKKMTKESVQDEPHVAVDDVLSMDDQEFIVRGVEGDRVLVEGPDGETHEISMSDIVQEDSQALETLKPGSRPADDPKSRIDMITKVLGACGKLPDDKLVSWFDQTMAQFGHYGDGVKDYASHNKDSVKMHPSDARESVEALFTGEELSEEFKERTTALFEAVIQDRLLAEVASLEEAYAERLESEVDELMSDLTERVESYLDYVAEEWMDDNEVAVENALRSEITEEFIEGLRELFADHYIDVPADRVDAFEALAARVEELESNLDETLVENRQLRADLCAEEFAEAFDEVAEGLPQTQRERLEKLAEGIDHGGDPETFAKKLTIIRENYLGDGKRTRAPLLEGESFEGGNEEGTVYVDPSVKRYVQAIDKTARAAN